MKTFAGSGALLELDNHVFMVKTRRRNMTRWELPSAVARQGERLEDTAFRCVFRESNQKAYVHVNSLICFCLHQSLQLDSTFFGAFFECSLGEAKEESNVSLFDLSTKLIPKDARQQIIQSGFVDWNDIPEREIHPLHKKLLLTHQEMREKKLFLITGDADAEIPFYLGWANLDSLNMNVLFI